MDKIRIGIVSDNLHGISGYANVTRHLLLHLSKIPEFMENYEVSQLALGGNIPKKIKELDWVKLCIPTRDRTRGLADFRDYISEMKPQIIITYNDPWLTYHPVLYKERPFKWIQYVAIDSYPIPRKIALNYNTLSNIKFLNVDKLLDAADMTIFFTEWSKKLAMNSFQLNGEKLEVIPHGINLNLFNPPKENEREKFRKEIFGNKVKPDDYLIITIARNQPRKLYGHMRDVILNFLRKLPAAERKKIKVYWHAEVIDMQGLNLDLLRTEELKRTIIFKHEIFRHIGPFVDDITISKIYKAADAHLLLTSREGFNIPALESMASNLPLILTDHPVHKELYGEYAYLVPYKAYTYAPYLNVTEHIPDVESATDILLSLYNEWKKGEKPLKVLRGFELARKYDWNIIAEKWFDKIKKISHYIMNGNEEKFNNFVEI